MIRREMKKLLAEKEKLQAEMAALDEKREHLQAKIAGLDYALLTLNDGVPLDPAKQGQRRVKRTILDIVNTAGSSGVTTNDVIQKAKANGRELNESSVSSLLSRLKAEGTLVFDGERYRPTTSKGTHPTKPPLTVVKTAAN